MIEAWKNLKPVIGMLHAPALPGSPNYASDLETIRSAVFRDAELLAEGGVHGLMIENFGDVPFFPHRVPESTAAHMSVLAAEVRRRFDLPLGINILRNDGRTALAIAHATGAQFIRVNILCGARVTDQGIVEGIAHDLMRDRALLGAGHIEVLADVDVKHSTPLDRLGAFELDDEVRDLVERAGADGLIVTGRATGKPPEVGDLETVKAATGKVPVFVGSGVSLESLDLYRALADGFIVGSTFKVNGVSANPVDQARVRAFMDKLR